MLRALPLLLVAVACGDVTPLQWDFRLEPGLDPARLRATIHQGNCEGEVIFEGEFPRGSVAPTPPLLDPDARYGFAILAHDASCVEVGYGCTVVTLPQDAVLVPVAPSGPAPACTDAAPRCVDRRCVP